MNLQTAISLALCGAAGTALFAWTQWRWQEKTA